MSPSARVGPYRLDGLLGRGAMGEVHRATDLRDNTVVALKLLPAAGDATADATGAAGVGEDVRVRARFRREAAVVARLAHPNIVGVRDHGEVEGHLFLAMDLIEGRDLAQVLAEQTTLEPTRAVRVIGQVAAALEAAHAAGVVHRDVKPSNILLARTDHIFAGDSGEAAYLADFGIALPGVAATRLTATGFALGTAAYMAPELFGNEPDATAASDVYALGCVLFEALTGRTPFQGPSAAALIYQHLHAPPPRPSRLVGLPEGVDDVIAAALAKTPRERYASAGALAHAAAGALAIPPAASATPPRRATLLLTRAWTASRSSASRRSGRARSSTVPLVARRWQPQPSTRDRRGADGAGGSGSRRGPVVALGLNVILGLIPAFGLGPVIDLCRVGRQCDQVWTGATVLAATVLGALSALVGLVPRRRRAVCTRVAATLFVVACAVLLAAIIFDH